MSGEQGLEIWECLNSECTDCGISHFIPHDEPCLSATPTEVKLGHNRSYTGRCAKSVATSPAPIGGPNPEKTTISIWVLILIALVLLVVGAVVGWGAYQLKMVCLCFFPLI